MANVYRYKKPADPDMYRVDTSGSNNIALGDMLSWYAAGPYAKALASGQEALFCGVAQGVAPTPTSNIDNATGKIDSVNVAHSGVFSFKTTNSESYSHGTAVKCGADAQTVTTSGASASNCVGYVWRPNESAALTGAAGVTVDVLLTVRYPATGLF